MAGNDVSGFFPLLKKKKKKKKTGKKDRYKGNVYLLSCFSSFSFLFLFFFFIIVYFFFVFLRNGKSPKSHFLHFLKPPLSFSN